MPGTQRLLDRPSQIVFKLIRQLHSLRAASLITLALVNSHLDEEQHALVLVEFGAALSDAQRIIEHMRKALENRVYFGRSEAYTRRVENSITAESKI